MTKYQVEVRRGSDWEPIGQPLDSAATAETCCIGAAFHGEVTRVTPVEVP